MQNVFGTCDKNISTLSDEFDVKIFTSNSVIKVTGEDTNVEQTLAAINALKNLAKKEDITTQLVMVVIDLVKKERLESINNLLGTIAITQKGKIIRAKSPGQHAYVKQ